MTINSITTTILWGALSGYLGIQLFANLLGILFCLHGLMMTRWKRLAKKVTGQIKYSINLQLIFRLSLYALFFVILLSYGDSFVRREFWFEFRGYPAIIFSIVSTIVALSAFRSINRRLRVIWRMSHEFDFAERRQRTRMLKS